MAPRQAIVPPMVIPDLVSLELPPRKLLPYDRDIGLRLLHEDPDSGVELYVIEYPAGLKATWHRHSAAHAMLVLDGELEVNSEVIGAGSLARYPAGTPMHHAPARDASCRFLMIFEGVSDVALVEDPEPA
jgi:quercetin dioxygenase-like cupin family protein